jgi:hypothetical protein
MVGEVNQFGVLCPLGVDLHRNGLVADVPDFVDVVGGGERTATCRAKTDTGALERDS